MMKFSTFRVLSFSVSVFVQVQLFAQVPIAPLSDVIGIIEVKVQSGQTTAIAPIFYSGAQAPGEVTGREGTNQLTVDWFDGTLNDYDTTWWQTLSPTNTAWAGYALYGSWIEESESWAFSDKLNGAVFEDYFPLSPSEKVQMMPLWTLASWIGLPTLYANDSEHLRMGGLNFFSYVDEAGESHWGWLPPGEVEPTLADDVALISRDELIEYRRAPGTSASTLVLTGLVRTGMQKIRITPSSEPRWQPLIRLDGKAWSLKSIQTDYIKNTPQLGFVAGTAPEFADHFRLLDATGNWMEYYYQKALPKTITTPAIVAGWRRWTIDRWVLLTSTELGKLTIPAYSGAQVWRPQAVASSETQFSFTTFNNTTGVKVSGLKVSGKTFKETTYAKVIVDRNKNQLPDGWEDLWFPPLPLPAVAKKILATDDPDLDGYNNLHEFLFGGNPLVFDAPGRPLVQVTRLTATSNPSYTLRFQAPPQFQYIIERRLGTESKFTAITKVVADSEGLVQFADTAHVSKNYDGIPRFYRVIAYAPIDTDVDGVSDHEELSYYGTRFDKKDSDSDGMSDGAELEAGRDPADYFDNRLASFTMATFSNGQFAAPGEWLLRPIEVKLTLKSAGTATKKALANAPVNFVMTHGIAVFCTQPHAQAAPDGSISRLEPSVTVKTNADGIARVWLLVSSLMDVGSLQGRATALLRDVKQPDSNILVDNLYSINFIAYAAPGLTMPKDDVHAWLRADSGLVPNENGTLSWKDSIGDDFSANVIQDVGGQFSSKPMAELQTFSSKSLKWNAARSWIKFDGKSRFSFNNPIPSEEFTCFYVAEPTAKTGAGITGDGLKNMSANWKKWVAKFKPSSLSNPNVLPYGSKTHYSLMSRAASHNFLLFSNPSPWPRGELFPRNEDSVLGVIIQRDQFTANGVQPMDFVVPHRIPGVGLGVSVGNDFETVFHLGPEENWAIPITISNTTASSTLSTYPLLRSIHVSGGTVSTWNHLTGPKELPTGRTIDLGLEKIGPQITAFTHLGGLERPNTNISIIPPPLAFTGRVSDLLLIKKSLLPHPATSLSQIPENFRRIENVLTAAHQYPSTLAPDRDGDNLPDWWELACFGHYDYGREDDVDKDGLLNLEEWFLSPLPTHPALADSDADGLPDGLEVDKNLRATHNALNWDSDHDLINDKNDFITREDGTIVDLTNDPSNGYADLLDENLQEVLTGNGRADGVDHLLLHSDHMINTDMSGSADIVALALNESVWQATAGDSDNDGMPDSWEIDHGLDPMNPWDAFGDPDNDGFTTPVEYRFGSHPKNTESVPPVVIKLTNPPTDNPVIGPIMAGQMIPEISVRLTQADQARAGVFVTFSTETGGEFASPAIGNRKVNMTLKTDFQGYARVAFHTPSPNAQIGRIQIEAIVNHQHLSTPDVHYFTLQPIQAPTPITGGGGTPGGGEPPVGGGPGIVGSQIPLTRSPFTIKFKEWEGGAISSSFGGADKPPASGGDKEYTGIIKTMTWKLTNGENQPPVEVEESKSETTFTGDPLAWVIEHTDPALPYATQTYHFQVFSNDPFHGVMQKITAKPGQPDMIEDQPYTDQPSFLQAQSTYAGKTVYVIDSGTWDVAEVRHDGDPLPPIGNEPEPNEPEDPVEKHMYIRPMLTVELNRPEVVPEIQESTTSFEASLENLPEAKVSDPYPIKAPYSGIIALSNAFYEQKDITVTKESVDEEGNPQEKTFTMQGHFGSRTRGKIDFEWDADWPLPLTTETRQEWLEKQFVLIEDVIITDPLPDTTTSSGETIINTQVKSMKDLIGKTLVVDCGNPLSKPDVSLLQRVRFLPIDLAIDADRNGTIASGETASQAKPFRFWINNDDDPNTLGDDVEEAMKEDELSPPGFEDWRSAPTLGHIDGVRDLEDFTRLHLTLPSDIIQKAKAGEAQIGFKWTNGSGPRIRIYKAEGDLGDEKYLFYKYEANLQVDSDHQSAVADVKGSQTTFLPSSYWQGIAAGSSKLNFIFEGCEKGTAKLTTVIKFGSSAEAEGAGVWIKLMDVQEMFERGKVAAPMSEADNVPDPWLTTEPLTFQSTSDPNGNAFQADPDETKQYIIHVHGWRMSYNEAQTWANTSYKRLWHLGYKGRFAFFSWPTFSGATSALDGYLTYNKSEYRAWLTGAALKSYVASLPSGYTKNIMAHSMGNVVVGSAFRQGMGGISNYALFNAAMAAQSYDPTRIDFPTRQTPDTDSDPTVQNRFGLSSKFSGITARVTNFYLEDDFATTIWSTNHAINKPQGILAPLDRAYGYSNAGWDVGGTIHKLVQLDPVLLAVPLRGVTMTEEAIAFVSQTRSLPAGRTPTNLGFSGGWQIDMDTFVFENGYRSLFGSEHSAEWIWSLQRTFGVWRSLLNSFDINPNPVP